MRIPILAVLGLALPVSLMLASCQAVPAATVEAPALTVQMNSCVTCHSSEESLTQTAAMTKEAKSEATSGEG